MDDPLVFFKVVYMNNGIPESTTSFAPVVYKIGEWITPKIASSKLFVFGQLYNAMFLSQLRKGSAVFECECKEARPFTSLLLDPYKYDGKWKESDVEEFWRQEIECGYDYAHLDLITNLRCSPPLGTWVASAVKLGRNLSMDMDALKEHRKALMSSKDMNLETFTS